MKNTFDSSEKHSVRVKKHSIRVRLHSFRSKSPLGPRRMVARVLSTCESAALLCLLDFWPRAMTAWSFSAMFDQARVSAGRDRRTVTCSVLPRTEIPFPQRLDFLVGFESHFSRHRWAVAIERGRNAIAPIFLSVKRIQMLAFQSCSVGFFLSILRINSFTNEYEIWQ